jgi:hypothetical protein
MEEVEHHQKLPHPLEQTQAGHKLQLHSHQFHCKAGFFFCKHKTHKFENVSNIVHIPFVFSSS